MKLLGKMFKYPKETNEVIVKDGRMMVHNHDGNDGYIYALKVDGNDELNFTLNKRDFKQLSMFNEFDITVKDSVIKIKSGSVKLTITNLIEHEVSNPDFTDLVDVNVKYEDLFKAKSFTGKDAAKIQVQGISVHSKCIVASDTYIFFEKMQNTDVEKSINIPKETFNSVPFSENIKIQTNGKVARLIFDGDIYYTSLINCCINQGLADSFLKDVRVCEVETANKDLKEKLSLIQNYDKYVDFKIKDRKLTLSGISEIESIDITIDDTPLIAEDNCFSYNIEKLKTMLSIVEDEKVTILISEKGCMSLKIEDKVMILPYKRSGR